MTGSTGSARSFFPCCRKVGTVTANPGQRPPAEAAAAQWERELRGLGTAERAVSEKAYLKSDLEFAGVPVPAMRAMVAAWCKARPGPRS